MKIEKTEKYTHLKPETETVEEVLNEIKNSYSQFENEHLILDFSENINTKIEELILILNLSTKHRENGTSFVVICEGINIDEVPDEINVVPTFTEALDILSMDEIERDLGF